MSWYGSVWVHHVWYFYAACTYKYVSLFSFKKLSAKIIKYIFYHFLSLLLEPL